MGSSEEPLRQRFCRGDHSHQRASNSDGSDTAVAVEVAEVAVIVKELARHGADGICKASLEDFVLSSAFGK